LSARGFLWADKGLEFAIPPTGMRPGLLSQNLQS
jgi:hypothetical protein